MKIDFIYWNTFYEYLKQSCFELNGDLTHDAKVINKTLLLWRNVSKEFLKKCDSIDLSNLWCDFDKNMYDNSYNSFYIEFMDYLFCATDRMNPNRWLYLQMCINRASDLVYKSWVNKYHLNDWVHKIKGGWGDYGCITKLEEDCTKEFEIIIKPLIIQNQELERKTKIENEIQN